MVSNSSRQTEGSFTSSGKKRTERITTGIQDAKAQPWVWGRKQNFGFTFHGSSIVLKFCVTVTDQEQCSVAVHLTPRTVAQQAPVHRISYAIILGWVAISFSRRWIFLSQ